MDRRSFSSCLRHPAMVGALLPTLTSKDLDRCVRKIQIIEVIVEAQEQRAGGRPAARRRVLGARSAPLLDYRPTDPLHRSGAGTMPARMRWASLARFAPALLAAGLFVAVCTVLRALLALRPDAALASGGQWAQVFALGFAFDLIAASYLVAPLVVWLALVPNRVARSKAHRFAGIAAFAVFAFV